MKSFWVKLPLTLIAFPLNLFVLAASLGAQPALPIIAGLFFMVTILFCFIGGAYIFVTSKESKTDHLGLILLYVIPLLSLGIISIFKLSIDLPGIHI